MTTCHRGIVRVIPGLLGQFLAADQGEGDPDLDVVLAAVHLDHRLTVGVPAQAPGAELLDAQADGGPVDHGVQGLGMLVELTTGEAAHTLRCGVTTLAHGLGVLLGCQLGQPLVRLCGDLLRRELDAVGLGGGLGGGVSVRHGTYLRPADSRRPSGDMPPATGENFGGVGTAMRKPRQTAKIRENRRKFKRRNGLRSE